MRVCADCRQKPSSPERFCTCCGRPVGTQALPSTASGRLQWVGSLAFLVTSIWTGMAGGFGFYTRQVGVTRAWTAVSVAVAAFESGKMFAAKPPAGSAPSNPGIPSRIR